MGKKNINEGAIVPYFYVSGHICQLAGNIP